ncbi:MAG: GNAT family N-acetyltransferase [Pseudomonadota bacterium]
MITLHPAAPEDAPVMAAILSDWIDETPWMPRLHTLEEDRAFCLRLVPKTIVARQAGQMVGFLARREEEVLCFYLAASARGQGVGAVLLAEAQRARPRLALWTFAENIGARRFYARNGFVETGGTEGDNDEGLPDIRMEWSRA